MSATITGVAWLIVVLEVDFIVFTGLLRAIESVL